MKLYNGTATIDTQYFGNLNIVKWENREHYIPINHEYGIIDEANSTNQYQVMRHCSNGYLVAVRLPD